MHTYEAARVLISQGRCVAPFAAHRVADACADAGEGPASRPYVELPPDYDDRGAPYCSAPWGVGELPAPSDCDDDAS